MQDVCARHGRSDAAAWSTRLAISRKSARSRCRRWRQTCRTGSPPEFFARYSLSQLRSLSPRELEACGRLVDPIYAGPGDRHYRVIAWEEALDRLSKSLEASGPNRSFFYASGRSSNEAGFLLQLLARAVRNEQRQQLFLLLPSGERRRTDGQPRHGHGDRAARRRRAQRSLRPHRWQSGVEPSTPDAYADGAAAPRRPRHRHQPGQRSRSGELSRAQRSAQPAVRHAASPASTCSRTSAVIMRCSPGVAKHVLERKGHEPDFIAQPYRRVRRVRAAGRGVLVGARSRTAPVSPRETIARIAEMYMSAQQRGVRLDDGHHPSPARRRERADDCQPGAVARHDRAAAGRSHADSRPQQRAGRRAPSASRRRSSRRYSRASRRVSGCERPRRRGSTPWPASKPVIAANCLRLFVSAATSSAATRIRSSPRGRSASSIRSPTCRRRSTPDTPGALRRRRSSFRCSRATKSRNRRRRSRCSATCD